MDGLHVSTVGLRLLLFIGLTSIGFYDVLFWILFVLRHHILAKRRSVFCTKSSQDGIWKNDTQYITTDNAEDIAKGVELLGKELYVANQLDIHKPREQYHVRCIAHVLNLAIREFMRVVHEKIRKVQKL